MKNFSIFAMLVNLLCFRNGMFDSMTDREREGHWWTISHNYETQVGICFHCARLVVQRGTILLACPLCVGGLSEH